MREFIRDVGGPVAIAELIVIGAFIAMIAVGSGLASGSF